jgi:uncharacterized protein YfaS (alpha-2-macroglobulin family)
MNSRRFAAMLAVVLWSAAFLSSAQRQPTIQVFSPQSTAKKVRQVRVQFSEPMVTFGDPTVPLMPFNVRCSEKGTARWSDASNWLYDFDRDLPAGIECEFDLKDGLKTLRGVEIAGQRAFRFSTGGPAILRSYPFEGSEFISDDQIFILELDAMPTESSVLTNVSVAVDRVSESIGIRIVSGQERETILKAQYYFRYQKMPENLLLIQAKQKFPADSRISLIWGKGVSASSGVVTKDAQRLPFKTKPPFTAGFHCQRENAETACIPVGAMRLSFSAPVEWKKVKGAILRGPAGKSWNPKAEDDEERFVSSILFPGPFPEKSSFSLELPDGVEDEAGRKLANAKSFPLKTKTDEYPPLAKFAADFGILELNADPMLPVTLRNIEATIPGKMFQVEGEEGDFEPGPVRPSPPGIAGNLRGRIFKVPSGKPAQIFAWIQKVSERNYPDRSVSVFGPVTEPKTTSIKIPKPNGGKAFEVVGIPFRNPGFYVVEIESDILGASLLGDAKPMFVPTTVLVTNLSVHFKWGIESSLAWITTLDKAEPVKQADVQVCDCEGKVLWKGSSNANGLARIGGLPKAQDLPSCSNKWFRGGLLVTAQAGPDMSIVQSGWDEGIESWRYNLPTYWEPSLISAHTILDRSLLRAGETVHMKHVLRRQVLSGFALDPAGQLPENLDIEHTGSDQTYELPLQWDTSKGVAITDWTIPRDAKLGEYHIYYRKGKPLDKNSRHYYEYRRNLYHAGSFRVEEFRVPFMRAVIRPPSSPLVAPESVPIDLTVSYLSGGGAGSLPIKFRHDLKERYLWGYEGFDGYTFSNGAVKEGIVRYDSEEQERSAPELKSVSLTLDKKGSVRTTVTGLPSIDRPMQIIAELEYRDPSGEIQTASSRIPLWAADRLVGLKPDSWLQKKNSLKFRVAVVDLSGKPAANAPVKVDLFRKKTYSHRKRLVGGFYAYEHYSETKRLGGICEGKTNDLGLLLCQKTTNVSGELILQATTKDDKGRPAVANISTWVPGEDDWWFAASDDDRIDLLPEKKRYEPGEKAKIQVRMPFRDATALISIEREGIGDAIVQKISGKQPIIEIPIKENYAPNSFISVMVVRGRVSGVQPTATVDLGRPAYKLGIAEVNVGWKAHELKVKVEADRPQYKTREKAKVRIAVTAPDGTPPPDGAEVALAAVDEGLLELMPNNSWNLLDSMMGRRTYSVATSTAQMHVIGKRHFGMKALPQGGGGGNQSTRELFDTLLLWKGRVPLNEKGIANVEIPLNDSITSFRIVAVAIAGSNRFGTGSTSIRTNRDLIVLSGIPPLVREGDKLRSTFTLRNTTEKALNVSVAAHVTGIAESLSPQTFPLGSGESRDIAWDLVVPLGTNTLKYQIEATAGADIGDRLSVVQKVVPAVPVRTFQATITQLSGEYRLDVERPKDALPEAGGIDVAFRPSLVEGLSGVKSYMEKYPYSCLEQDVSKAVALRDSALWNKIAADLPAYLDPQGLLKYFPSMHLGSDVLTSYVLSVSSAAGYTIPEDTKWKMTEGLQGFIEGRIIRYSSLPTVDLAIRKLSAIEALSGYGRANPSMLSSIAIETNLWPTSAVIDWFIILQRMKDIQNRNMRLSEAEQILRTRLSYQGTTMNFSTERGDFLWWLMASPDGNSARLVLSVLELPSWKEDISRVVRGSLARQRKGRWDTTVANAWGVLAMERFSQLFEKIPVTGTSSASLDNSSQSVQWSAASKGKTVSFPWPPKTSALTLRMSGTGQPWATIISLAAIPLTEPLANGYKIKKAMIPVDQKVRGVWSRGDIVRVRLEIEAQSDMTWAVLSDPIPAGASILGSGLGRDSSLATRGEDKGGWVEPAYEERSFEAYRAYYEYLPKGTWTIEYTVRLNNEGTMTLPPTRVEAMYSPEMFGERPNEPVNIR